MLRLSKLCYFGVAYLALSFCCSDSNQLSAYVSVPRSTADTTDRMNAGGDPADRPGLRDLQRHPEYLDDYWGRNDYYYSEHGIKQTGTIVNPAATTHPLPNTYYQEANSPPTQYYNTTRYYRPAYPR